MAYSINVWNEELNKYVRIPILKGDPGETPQRGVDYWTDSDKAEIINELRNHLILQELNLVVDDLYNYFDDYVLEEG